MLVDNAVFYKPGKVTKVQMTEVGNLQAPLSDLNVAIAACDNLVVSNGAKTLREWWLNLTSIPDLAKRVRKLAFFDTETHKLQGYIVSIGVVLYDMQDDRVLEKYYTLLNPVVSMDEEAQGVHGISDEMVANAPYFSDIYPRLSSIFGQADMMIAFNAEYDIDALTRECCRSVLPPLVLPYLDPMKRLKNEIAAKGTNGRIKNPKLKECADYYGIEFKETELHNSLYDTEVTLEVFRKAISNYRATA